MDDSPQGALRLHLTDGTSLIVSYEIFVNIYLLGLAQTRSIRQA